MAAAVNADLKRFHADHSITEDTFVGSGGCVPIGMGYSRFTSVARSSAQMPGIVVVRVGRFDLRRTARAPALEAGVPYTTVLVARSFARFRETSDPPNAFARFIASRSIA
jgi:hypothetical protein